LVAANENWHAVVRNVFIDLLRSASLVTYRTKVRTIEAFRWEGQPRQQWPHWATPELLNESGSALYAYTTSGPVRVEKGSWVILGKNEAYPCIDKDFRERYELALPAETHFQGTTQGVAADEGDLEDRAAEGSASGT